MIAVLSQGRKREGEVVEEEEKKNTLPKMITEKKASLMLERERAANLEATTTKKNVFGTKRPSL